MATTEYDYALDMRMRLARRAVVTPLTGREVAIAVREARDQETELALDLSKMKRIVIDARERTARVQPGVNTRALEDAASPYDFAPLLDHRGLVGANLLAAQVVLPDGELVQADDALLREIRSASAGSGHAVGIVVDATYRLHPARDLIC